jgi:hypothetical protein
MEFTLPGSRCDDPHYLRHPCRDVSSAPAILTIHALTTHLYCDYTAIRDRQGRTARAGGADVLAALYRLIDTDKAMDDADANLHHHHHAWRTGSEDRI